LIPPHPFINTQVDDRIPKSGFRNGADFHSLITKFTGKAGIALQVCVLEILKKTREVFCVSEGAVCVAHILSCVYGIG
jgi:hypothetical protein